LKAWPILGITLMQAFLLSAHWFIYRTMIDFWPSVSPAAASALRIALLILGFSFIAAALLGFRYDNRPVKLLYKLAAVWLGFLNFFFFASCLCLLTGFASVLAGLPPNRPLIAVVFYGLALLAGGYGLLNARWVRVRRVAVSLPGLPSQWRGRTALLLSDLHLGNVNGPRFSRRMAVLGARLNPDIVFIPGDLFDGSGVDPDRLLAPFQGLKPLFGIFFSSGNHEEFGDEAHFAAALSRAAIRVLGNEMVTVDDLQILGVSYHDSTSPIRLRSILEGLRIDPAQASILLNHMPSRLPIVERAGVSLQLSGHTHGGQIFPFNWFTRRVFGKFTYGLQSFGSLQVYTSSGAGTWGPPMRVGTHPEIVLITFA
jgi:predicted MPP superfamily phosphohydrolase